ncbi:MAG: MBL fold metallo-hydrolase [Eubacteriales bacterium]|nr:MBL fold metallo-hydrolase [Eubacteriales bacterium]
MSDYIIKTVEVGQLHTNCYILKKKNDRNAIVIDPGGDLTVIKDALFRLNATCSVILLTHGHFDHILALGDLKTARTVVCIHKDDAHYLIERDVFSTMVPFDPRPFDNADILFDKEGIYKVQDFEFYVMPTPGHTKGSVCYIFGDIIFCGDTLFKGGVGTTAFDGNDEDMDNTLRMLYNLPGDYAVYPGHEGKTTLSDEREHNPCFAKFRR